jgi:hypothetical protein
MTTGEDAANPLVYGEFSHPFVLEKDQVIDIVVNNLGMIHSCDTRSHSQLTILQILESILSIFTVIISKLSFDLRTKRGLSMLRTLARPSFQPFQ